MMIDGRVWFQDAQRLQLELLSLEAFFNDGDEIKELEAMIAVEAAFYAADISPFWTGALSSAHMVVEVGDMHWIILNPAVRNPITGDAPADYGIEQHAIGGKKAFYTRTEQEIGDELLALAGEEMIARFEAFS